MNFRNFISWFQRVVLSHRFGSHYRRLFEFFIKWNNDITSKEEYHEFFFELDKCFKFVFGEKLKLNITEEEFNKMSVEGVRTLVNDALNDMLSRT